MTARRILRRVLLAALLCVLLASAALAVDSIQDAQANLEKTVEKQAESFVVSLPSDDYLASYTAALQNHILEQENWVDVSPRITVEPNTGIMQDTAIIVRLRYAENHGEYKDALDAAAAAACGLHRQTQGPSAQRRRPGAGADAADCRRGTMRVRRGAPCGFCDTIKSRRALVN